MKNPFHRLSFRLTLFAFLIILIPAGIALGLLGNKLKNDFRRSFLDNLMMELNIKTDRASSLLQILKGVVESNAEHFEEDIKFYGGLEENFSDGFPTPGFFKSDLYQDLVSDMNQTIQESKYYVQFRIILANGQELIRFNRTDSGVEQVPVNKLQNKSGRDYLKHILAHKGKLAHIMPVSLNREQGKFSLPHTPMIRVGKRITLKNGKPFGVVVLNVATELIFGSFTDKKNLSFFIIDSEGYYLYHRVKELLFGKDLGHGANLLEEEPELKINLSMENFRIHYDPELKEFRVWKKVFFDHGSSKYWVFMERLSETSIVSPWFSVAEKGLAKLAVILFIGFVLLTLAVRKTIHPLKILKAAIEKMKEGDLKTRANVKSKTEIGDIAKVFNSMAEKLEIKDFELRRSMALSHSISDMAPNSIIIIDANGTILMVNPAVEQIFGYRTEELIGQNVSILMPAPHRELHDQYIHNYLETGITKIIGKNRELEAVRKNGQKFPINLHINEATVEEEIVFVGIIEDISKRKKNEESIQRFQATVNTSVDAIFLIDPVEMRFVDVNRTACESIGYTREELLAMGPHNIKSKYTKEELAGRFEKIIMDKTKAGTIETVHQRKDGSRFPVEVFLSALKIGGRFILTAVARDMTERKKMMDKLTRANEEIKSFAHIISHDLRTPLVNLKGFSQELKNSCVDIKEVLEDVSSHLSDNQKKRIKELFQEDIPEALDFIDSSTSSMDRMISNILTLAKIGSRELLFEKINTRKLVEEKIKVLHHQIESKKIKIKINELPNVTADEPALDQIFGNILSNSINYLDPNRPGVIEIYGEQRVEDILFSVKDNGRGIAEEDRHKVFELFRRAGKQDVPGHGIGLPYVKALIERFSGEIWFESEEGKGTTFYFTIQDKLV